MYYWTLHYAYSSTDKDCRITVESEQQFSRQSKISHFPLIFAKIRKYNNWVTNLMSGDSAELGTRQLYSLSTTTTRQRNRASVIRKSTKNVKVVASKWISHNKYRPNAIINNFLAWKHVVAAVLSHAQLCIRMSDSLDNKTKNKFFRILSVQMFETWYKVMIYRYNMAATSRCSVSGPLL